MCRPFQNISLSGAIQQPGLFFSRETFSLPFLQSGIMVINVENARVYLGGQEILHNISWKVERGERCFILGANGAGKTTLVKLLMGFAWPIYGAKVEILDKTLGQVNLADLRKSIAWVSPFIQQWLVDHEWTGLDMVISGREGTIGLFRAPSEEEVIKAREIMTSLRGEHLLDRTVQTMSSGEQVKILIGRALMNEPDLMILDEPSVYLDIAGREFLLNTINELAQKRPDLTIVFITQRIEDILPVFNKGMILKAGNIVAHGRREEVLTEENLKNAFDLDIKLIQSQSGRFWTVIE